MGKLLQTEKNRYEIWKQNTKYISSQAKHNGAYKGIERPFCLPEQLREENLYDKIRDESINFFYKHEIKWHDARNKKPSNHLCDSQVCCVTFLFPWSDKPESLAKLLKRYYSDLKRMLPIEDGRYVTFKYIGKKNYLREKVSTNGKRTRGANYTSADAAVMFEKENGQRQIVLIEWKYTESYSSTSLKQAKSGTDRTSIYRWLYDASDTIINKNIINDFGDLFYEPLYQLMRQQFLVNEMEKTRELGADIVSILHINPKRNKKLHRVTSPNLIKNGEDVFKIWSDIINNKNRFKVYTQRIYSERWIIQIYQS